MAVGKRGQRALGKKGDLSSLTRESRLTSDDDRLEEQMGELVVFPRIAEVLIACRTEYPQQPHEPHRHAGLFVGLTASTLCRSVTEVLAATGQSPKSVVKTADEQNTVGIVGYENVATNKGSDELWHSGSNEEELSHRWRGRAWQTLTTVS